MKVEQKKRQTFYCLRIAHTHEDWRLTRRTTFLLLLLLLFYYNMQRRSICTWLFWLAPMDTHELRIKCCFVFMVSLPGVAGWMDGSQYPCDVCPAYEWNPNNGTDTAAPPIYVSPHHFCFLLGLSCPSSLVNHTPSPSSGSGKMEETEKGTKTTLPEGRKIIIWHPVRRRRRTSLEMERKESGKVTNGSEEWTLKWQWQTDYSRKVQGSRFSSI